MSDWLSPEFWQATIEKVMLWMIASLPSLVVIVLLGVVGLKALTVVLRKSKDLMLARSRSVGAAIESEVEKRIDTLVGILRTTSRLAIWCMVIMLVLRKIGVDIAPLIAGAGIAGLAVGFGGQELVRDVISGFFILLENQVRTGDVAIVNGTGGLVENIGLRTITLRDLSGTVHVFQNGKINTMANMTKEWSGMVLDIGVAYKEDTDKVAAIMMEVAEQLRVEAEFADKILEPMEIFGVDSFGDSAVVVKARFKTKPIQQWAVGREYRRRLKKAFDEQGVEIPFPHRTIYWGEASKPFAVAMGGAGK